MPADTHFPGKSHKENFFLHLKPLTRVFMAAAIAFVVFLSVPNEYNHYFKWLVTWNVFAGCYLILCWIILLTMPVSTIRKNASKEDGSKLFVFIMIILTSLAGMLAVLLLIMHGDYTQKKDLSFLLIAISGMVLSWAIVHTIFTFHYAHLFYGGNSEGGLEFPGDEKEPDYLDFAYFSFVIGCTFQVSDVEISYRKIRRLALVHGLLAFVLNTFVVALSINIISGLLK
jgi:uncharacterized membrane protein